MNLKTVVVSFVTLILVGHTAPCFSTDWLIFTGVVYDSSSDDGIEGELLNGETCTVMIDKEFYIEEDPDHRVNGEPVKNSYVNFKISSSISKINRINRRAEYDIEFVDYDFDNENLKEISYRNSSNPIVSLSFHRPSSFEELIANPQLLSVTVVKRKFAGGYFGGKRFKWRYRCVFTTK